MNWWMNEWIIAGCMEYSWVDAWVYARVDEWVDALVYVRMDTWVDKCKNGWMHASINIMIHEFINEWVAGWLDRIEKMCSRDKMLA